jgi:hypothetical protein
MFQSCRRHSRNLPLISPLCAKGDNHDPTPGKGNAILHGGGYDLFLDVACADVGMSGR